MTDLTYIFARSIKDLTLLPQLPDDLTVLDQVKIPVGNLPVGLNGCEALSIQQLRTLVYSTLNLDITAIEQKVDSQLLETQELVDSKLLETQTTVESQLSETQTIVDSKLAQNKSYTDQALSQLSTAANKFYPTLVDANTDIANIQVDQPVTIGESANGGLWYKATAEATSLTKSLHDPLTQSKNYADANPLFNPVALTTVNNADELVSNGLYTAPTTNIAQAVGFPFGTSGQLLVTTSPNYVLQTYYLDTGEVFQRRKTVSGWSELKGQLFRTLGGSDALNNFTKSGIFQCVSNTHATETNNYPFSARGVLFVQTNGTTVTQHFLGLSGYASRAFRLDQPENGWEAWRGVTFPTGMTSLSSIAYKGENISRRIDSMSALNGHLDRAVTSGRWQTIVRSIATTENGFPITDTVGTLEVSSEGNLVVIQKWQTYKGTAYRYGSYNSQSVLTWQPWRGYINSDNGLTDITNALVIGQSPIKRISALSEIGTHLDDVRTTGMWHTTLRSIATTENGFPITDVIGVIEVSASGTQAITQYWRSYKGLAVRWGSYNAQGVLTWQPWRGYLLSESGITQLGESETTTTTQTQLITFGSSTLWYLEDELKTLATSKNLRLRPNAKSGYTLGAAGLNQGTNKMSVQFASGVITTGINTVIIESSFNDDIRAAMTVELSNGVKGSLNYRDKTFTPSNLTASLTVSSTEKYKVTVPLWNDINAQGGVFIFNIGKNSVSSSTDNSDYIVEKTVEMIEAIPIGSKFIVGGHFSNWVGTSNETHHNVVHSVNQKLRLKYGLKYFDIAELFAMDSTWTTLGLTKTADDIAAIAANRMPPSLSRDAAHMSAGMDLIVAQVIENKLIELGYIS